MDGDLRDDDKKASIHITSQFASCFNPAASSNQIVVDNLAMSFQHNNGTGANGDKIYLAWPMIEIQFFSLAGAGRLIRVAVKRYPLP